MFSYKNIKRNFSVETLTLICFICYLTLLYIIISIFRVETIDGTARRGEDYVALREIVTFEPGEKEKQVCILFLIVFEPE